MKYTDNHELIMFLGLNGIEPHKESGKTAYYINTKQLRQLIETYWCRKCFYRGNKFEN